MPTMRSSLDGWRAYTAGLKAQLATALAPSAPPVVDDFNGPGGSPPDPALWCYNTGGNWPGELQTYTNDPANVSLDGLGHLAITAHRAADGTVTSGRIKTEGRLAVGYGRVEASIKMPPGPGILPAFWLLGANYDTVGSLAAGEIDIVEYVRGQLNFTVHGPAGDGDYNGGGRGVNVSRDLGFDPSAGFHRYWVVRSPNKIVIGVDETTTSVVTPKTLPPGGQWVFNAQPMIITINFAVGGTEDGWPGMPDADTPFHQTMLIDYVRYQP